MNRTTRVFLLILLPLLPAVADAQLGEPGRGGGGRGRDLLQNSGDSQKLTYSTETQRTIDAYVRDLMQLAGEAANAEDETLADCLNERLNDLRQLDYEVGEADRALRDALGVGDDVSSQDSFQTIVDARDQADRFMEDARICPSGKDGAYPGRSSLSVTYSGNKAASAGANFDTGEETVRFYASSPF